MFFIQIRTTSPEKFRIRPSTDILGPGSSTNVCIVLQAVQNASLEQHKDKFLIMCMELNDRNATPQELIDLWKVNMNVNEKKKINKTKSISLIKNPIFIMFHFLFYSQLKTMMFLLNNIV